MTPDHVRRLVAQVGTQQALADAVNAHDPLLRVTLNAISRYARGVRTPGPHVTAALTAAWLSRGYPCTANGRPATLTTNSPASSHGLPVVVIDGAPHGSAEVARLDLGDVPDGIRAAAMRSGYARIGDAT
jgi:hypothetical protein